MTSIATEIARGTAAIFLEAFRIEEITRYLSNRYRCLIIGIWIGITFALGTLFPWWPEFLVVMWRHINAPDAFAAFVVAGVLYFILQLKADTSRLTNASLLVITLSAGLVSVFLGLATAALCAILLFWAPGWSFISLWTIFTLGCWSGLMLSYLRKRL